MRPTRQPSAALPPASGAAERTRTALAVASPRERTAALRLGSGAFRQLLDGEPGRGATFKVYLPRVDEPVSATARAESTAPRGGSETVLLVEDDQAVRTLTEEILGRQGYTVLSAGFGSEALEVAARHEGPIQLLVTDVVMPGQSGGQLAGALAVTRPGMRVLYLSGYTDNTIVHHGVLDPGTAFLGKPFTLGALLRKVREVLDAG